MNDFELMVNKYTVKYNNKIKRFCKPLLQHFNINYFWYYQIKDNGQYHCFGSHAPWMEHYYAEKLYLRNPYLRHPSNYSTGVSLIRKIKDVNFQKSIEIGQNLFDVNLSLVLMEKKIDWLQGFGFASNLDTDIAEKMYLAELPLLRLFAGRFIVEFDSLIKASKYDFVDLSSAMGNSFYVKNPLCRKPDQIDVFLQSMGASTYATLSKREKEVLLLISKGYSACRISDLLFLSIRTIEYYIDNIKNKLDCFSKSELVQRGCELASLGDITQAIH